MNEALMQHGTDYSGQDLTGWHITEKFDGCRAYWDGADLWTRGGLRVQAPLAMRAALPAHPLDCELYDGPGGRARCSVAARWGRFTPTMHLVVFDAPTMHGDQADRLDRSGVSQDGGAVRRALLRTATSNEDVLNILNSVLLLKGEGLMACAPEYPYTAGRVQKLVKVKYADELDLGFFAVQMVAQGGAV